MKKKAILCGLMLLAALLLAACGGAGGEEVTSGGENTIRFTEGGAEISGSGLARSGSVVTISKPGSYTVSGKTLDGQLVVDVPGEGVELELMLDGVSITNLSGPAIHIETGKDLKLRFRGENSLTSGTPVMTPDGSSSGAALYAEDDMSIRGEDDGVLRVFGYINNGIACKNDLDLKSGNIQVTAVNNGIRGSDSVEIKGGKVTVEAGNDGVKSTTTDKEGKGYIHVEGGSLSVTAQGDGLSAETELKLLGGSVTVNTTGDPLRESCKGLKANRSIRLEGGKVTVEAQDHALQCNGDIAISGGEQLLRSAQAKGIKLDGALAVSGGKLQVQSVEDGVDSIGDVSISDGMVEIRSSRDGIQSGEANSGRGSVLVSGGTVLVDAGKLGFNPRGELNISGGVVLALSGSEKNLPGRGFAQQSWDGVRGSELSLSRDGAVLAALRSQYGFRSVLAGVSDGAYSLTDGSRSIEIG